MNTRNNFPRAAGMWLATLFISGFAQAQTLEPALGTQPAVVAPAIAPLSAEASAVRSAVHSAFGAGSEVAQGYQGIGFKPVWLDTSGKPTDAARVLLSTLKAAGNHALPASKYRAVQLESQFGTAGWALEAALTRSFVEYAQDMRAGVLNPRDIDSELHIYPERPSAGDLLWSVSRATDMTAYLDALAPQDPAYQRLVERYAAYRAMGAEPIWGDRVASGRTIRPGNQNARVAQARARLTAMGDLDPNIYDKTVNLDADGTQLAANDVTTDIPLPAFDPSLFDAPMADALRRFQERHGLNLDGVIGPATLKQLNVSPQTRARQIAVTLERMRWLNRDRGDRHILVKLAGCTMAVINNGTEEFSSRTVIGKAKEHRTPEFSDEMTHMVVNPSWYVPTSIKEKEIMPKVKADPNYLAKRNMRMQSNGRIVQGPGPRNALGTVKFMFPNKFAIYLHDTPSKRLFKRDVRAYSHGCVRVERPHELAHHLLGAQQSDPAGYFRRLLNRGKERRVDLDDPLPVHITYRTAWIDHNGVEQFRGDIYRRDAQIAKALAAAGAI
ncbi:MAG: murein L,D-transpeptidase [Paracoccaceae bacterium]